MERSLVYLKAVSCKKMFEVVWDQCCIVMQGHTDPASFPGVIDLAAAFFFQHAWLAQFLSTGVNDEREV